MNRRFYFVMLLVMSGIMRAGAQCPTVSSVTKVASNPCGSTSSYRICVVTAVVGATYQAFKDGAFYGSPATCTGSGTLFTVVETTTAGVYTVTAAGGSCSNVRMNGSAVVDPSVPTQPPVPTGSITLSGSPNICEGGSLLLTATAGYSNYQWRKEGVNIPMAGGNTLTVSAAGNYSVVVFGGPCNNSTTWSAPPITILQKVKNLTTPVGPFNFCQGTDPITYTANAVGATNYTWSVSQAGSSHFTSSGPNGKVTWDPSFSGTALIQVTATGCGNSSAVASLHITIAPNAGTLPLIDGVATLCQGVSASTFTLPTNAATIYDWKLRGAGNSTVNNLGTTATVLWDPDFAGRAVIMVEAKGCNNVVSARAHEVNIISGVGPAVIASGPVNYCRGTGLSVFTARADDATNFFWTLSPATAGSIDRGTVTWNQAFTGVATVALTASGCSGASSYTTTDVFVGDLPACHENYNYIRTVLTNVPNIYDANQVQILTVDERAIDNQYFDGLGRFMQQVVAQGSPGKHDFVTPVAYDDLGREYRKYLPYESVGRTGGFKTDALLPGRYEESQQFLFYANGTHATIATTNKPFAETVFEASPLNRVLKQGAPGEAWQPNSAGADHAVKSRYLFNADDDKVLLILVGPETGELYWETSANGPQYYSANALRMDVVEDEEGHRVISYTDKFDRMVLKRVVVEDGATKQYADTYYVYDDVGNLIMVMPPEAVASIIKSY